MKKISRRLFLACVLSGALLAGCGETKTTPVAPGTAQPATTYPNPNPNYPNPNPNPYPEAGTPTILTLIPILIPKLVHLLRPTLLLRKRLTRLSQRPKLRPKKLLLHLNKVSF